MRSPGRRLAQQSSQQALSPASSDGIFSSNPKDSIARWTAMLGNYCRRQSKDQLLHTLPGFESSALAYRFSEASPEDAPEPLGIIDLGQYSRAETAPMRVEFLKWLGENRKAFFEVHGDFLILSFLGTKPEMQGQGMGSLVLDHLDDLADEQGIWTYLEASTEDSRRLYKRHGYEDISHKAWVPKDFGVDLDTKLDIFLMGRPPKPAKTANGL
ncbi:MAG: hypothetical protein WDW36_002303 [Sanguina aurantia]